jgi:uncharacterized membrane protein YeaQ/YmgE (transglycosylase-associated protein family)
VTALFWVLLAVVGFWIFGWAVIDVAWTLLGYVVVGLVVGGLARVLVRQSTGYGLGATILVGILGSLLGGVLAAWLDVGWLLGLVISVLVSAVLIAVTTPGLRRD